MNILLRAIITGFGYKMGADIYRYIGRKVGLPFVPKESGEEDEEDDDEDRRD